jgi:hypothetical protein
VRTVTHGLIRVLQSAARQWTEPWSDGQSSPGCASLWPSDISGVLRLGGVHAGDHRIVDGQEPRSLVRREPRQLDQGLGVVLGDHLLRGDFDEFHLCKVSNLAGEEIHRRARDLKSVTALRRVPKPASGAHFVGFRA